MIIDVVVIVAFVPAVMGKYKINAMQCNDDYGHRR